MIPLLLLEDEPRVASFLCRGLKAESYQVTLATTGTEALAHGLGGRHDLIVLDVMVPELDGMEVCRRLRGAGIATPIMMLTARDSPGDEIDGLENGADDYLTKPFAFELLLARLGALYRRRHLPIAAAGGPRVVGRLTIDLSQQEASVDGVSVELTRRELDVLAILAGQPGRVVSREKILAGAWGAGEDPLTNVVDVYIARLRRKLGERIAIQTVRGAGYKLVLTEPLS